ncbi:MAG: DUF3365 domain-containing protein [Acidobacteria bacterium]|nr:DUF3365 domain-containing protein [Acidobacteriota bacterium]
MKCIVLLLTVMLLLGGILADTASNLSAARAAADKLGADLVKELRRALKKEGVTAAVAVCHERAPAIAATITRETGYTVGRTSLRVRNPQNAPDAWEKKVLAEFADRHRLGEALKNMEYSEVVETKDGREFRYMKAIPTRKLCLQCHGTNVPPELAAILKEKYPQDKATGFAAGDLRGAFTIRKKLE